MDELNQDKVDEGYVNPNNRPHGCPLGAIGRIGHIPHPITIGEGRKQLYSFMDSIMNSYIAEGVKDFWSLEENISYILDAMTTTEIPTEYGFIYRDVECIRVFWQTSPIIYVFRYDGRVISFEEQSGILPRDHEERIKQVIDTQFLPIYDREKAYIVTFNIDKPLVDEIDKRINDR